MRIMETEKLVNASNVPLLYLPETRENENEEWNRL